MKSPHEIAWNMMDADRWEPRAETLSVATGIDIEEIRILQEKRHLVWFLSKGKDRLSLMKQVIEEIEQEKPHWEIVKNQSL